jgi:outer membrane protein OmpA-like peptidoglycan-associated protein
MALPDLQGNGRDRPENRSKEAAMRRVAMLAAVMMLVVSSMATSGCYCAIFNPKPKVVDVPPADLKQIPEPEPPAPAPRPTPAPIVLPPLPTPPAPAPAPAPVVAPAPMPAAVVAAIEDLGKKYPGLFVFDKEKGLFLFSADITFDSGSSVVKPGAKAALTKLAEILSVDIAKDRALKIVGYTDTDRVGKASTIAHLKSLNKPANNQGLSEARAESVAAILTAGGVTANRITTAGKGEANPVAENTTAAGKSKNRRVEIYLTPMAGATR